MLEREIIKSKKLLWEVQCKEEFKHEKEIIIIKERYGKPKKMEMKFEKLQKRERHNSKKR